MDGTYPVTYLAETVGSVSLCRKGLYYELSCCCRVNGKKMLRLVMNGAGQTEDFGLLIPQNGRLELTKRIPAKRLGAGEMIFVLQCREDLHQTYYTVDPAQPVSFLHRLEECRLAVRNGKAGILLPGENNGEKVEF